MGRFTFVHAADLHLDTPFEGVGRVLPAIADVLRDASLRAWERLVDLVLARDAAFLVLAGDLYDGAERGIRAQLQLRRGFERLAERGVPVFVVYGNHDPLVGWSAVSSWPPGVHVFGSAAVESAPAMRGGKLLAMVHGRSFARSDCSENLALDFRRGREAALHVGLLHANAGNQPGHAVYAPCTLEDLDRAAMDYWALGHVHRRTYLRQGPGWVVYPGNTQSRRRAAGESGAKGAVVVQAEDDRVVGVEFAALDSVRFVDVEADVSHFSDVSALRALLAGRAEELQQVHRGCALLLTAVLSGRRAPSLGLSRPDESEEVLDDLRRGAGGHTPFVWWSAIEDMTAPEVDPAPLVERDDLIGAVLRHAEDLIGDAPRRARFLDQCCEPLLQRWIAELDPADAEAIVQEGRDLVFELLRRSER
jgi:DNA repair exonuclease SbcCD nuclease subunit